MKKKGKLFLIPVSLGENSIFTIPEYVIEIIHSLDIFIAEKNKTARRFIKETGIKRPLQELIFFELNKHTKPEEWSDFLLEAESDKNIGLLSEAGCPAVADPGGEIVRLAHKKGIEIIPLVGPSSILLALMASGMNGQKFSFHGYLSPKRTELSKELKRLEKLSRQYKQTQIFIETPYRNKMVFETALNTLLPDTLFCIAVDITLATQQILTKSIKEWKKTTQPDLHKRPAVFLLFVT
ncbi:MAG: SAM-dependent methyltransferase [Bacteroidetes bacterium]|nr:SAM-dependent methyltransferase [Bacteroidota bacterium]